MNRSQLAPEVLNMLQRGMVIPALPLALGQDKRIDEKRQRALIRYYLNAGAGGIAVAVHTTQFEIRQPGIDLYEPILELAREELIRFESKQEKRVLRIAGAIGKTSQAIREASLARDNDYHAVLLSLAAFSDANNIEILEHCKAIAEVIPVVGFYLQPAVGGHVLDVDFWREFAQIENVIAIKMAPFNRYQTFDVVRAVVESGRADEIALYTGNDDNILVDLLTEYNIQVGEKWISKRIVGGLLGHWAVWTKTAVQLLEDVHNGKYKNDTTTALKLANQITDCNSAFFDAKNNFAGCITGIHEVLRRQGLLNNISTLNENDALSSGQSEEIDRVYRAYPHLNDDKFVRDNIDDWLA